MGACDNIAVDLVPVDFDVTICATPAFEVEIIQSDLTLDAVSIAGQGPKGDKGDQGDQGVPGTPGAAGAPGSPGTAASVNAGTTTTGAPGTNANVVNSGISSTAIFDFTIPRGDVGATGPMGQGIVIKGSVPNHAALPATGNTSGDVWVTSDTGHGWAWNGTAWVDIGPIQGPPGAVGPSGPAGSDGVPGAAGSAATVAAGITATGAPGTNAAVINTGSSSAAVFAFTIPRGDVGAVGPAGVAGGAGSPGAAGGNAWTLVTNASFTVPIYGGNVTVQAGDTSWVALGEWIYIDDANGPGVAGQLIVTAKTPTTLTLFNPTPSTYPLADSTRDGLLRKVSGNTSDFIDGTNNCQPIAPQITAVRLRAYNSLGNQNFEVDQRNASTAVNAVLGAQTFFMDRWAVAMLGSTIRTSGGQATAGGTVVVPGTSYRISSKYLNLNLTAAQATLAAGDILSIQQYVEGSALRELLSDVHSLSMLVSSSVAGLKFGVSLVGGSSTQSLSKLCTIPTANTWTLITLPNLPAFPAVFSSEPGVLGYQLRFCLAAGSSFLPSANDTWQTGTFYGAIGQDNFASKPVNSTFSIAFVQNEPGPLCTTLMDKPFSQNLDECLRYFCKSYEYGQIPGSAVGGGPIFMVTLGGLGFPVGNAPFPKPMAKVPGVSTFNAAGTAGGANMFGGAAVTVNAATNTATRILSLTLSANQTAGWGCQFNYQADTGW